jgi:hypothetical protein
VVDNGVPAYSGRSLKFTVLNKIVVWSLSNEFHIIDGQSIGFYSSCALDEQVVGSSLSLEGDSIGGDLIIGGHNISDQHLVPEYLSAWFFKRLAILSCIFKCKGKLAGLLCYNVIVLR